MIVAQRKKVPELVNILKGRRKILLLGCGTCVTVCLAGGEREVSINASALRIASRLQNLAFQVEELTIERQCDNVLIEKAAEAIERNDVVLSLGCGAGVQAIAERYEKPVYAGLDTAFIGILEERATWTEKCIACGICVRNCPSGSIKSAEGEKREGEKRKTATTYILDYTTCSQCGICVESCPYDALDFSADFNLVGYKREDFHFDLVKEFEKRKNAA